MSGQPFPQAELARLTVYKAAVAAGFFTDAYPETPAVSPMPTMPATGLSRQDVARLVALKAAMRAGYHSEFISSRIQP